MPDESFRSKWPDVLIEVNKLENKSMIDEVWGGKQGLFIRLKNGFGFIYPFAGFETPQFIERLSRFMRDYGEVPEDA